MEEGTNYYTTLGKFSTLNSNELDALCKANGVIPHPVKFKTILRLMQKNINPDSIHQVGGSTFSDPGLEGVRAALEQAKRPFFCTGTLPLDPNNNPISILVRNKDNNNNNNNKNGDTFTAVHFPLVSDDHMKPLLDASLQASFGRGDKNVIDPSYRRALFLNKEDFAIHPAGSLEPHGLGIITSIAESLLESSVLTENAELETRLPDLLRSLITSEGEYSSEPEGRGETRIIAHLDKLNVYSEGDFFKGHVDTPHSEEMFATLLINLPVEHEGGQLVIKEPLRGGSSSSSSSEREEFKTEWNKASGFEWVAFFSDCEHEVLPVTRGHRVTLTYTLSFEESDDEDCPPDVEKLAGSKDVTREALCRALQAPSVFSPERPRLCFYMAHKYPMDGLKSKADGIANRLKGRDAVLYHALIGAGVSVSFHHVLYLTHAPRVILGEGEREGDAQIAILPRSGKVKLGLDYIEESMGNISVRSGARTPKALGIVEVTQNPAKFVKIEFMAYGNEARVDTEYGTVCMIATMKGYDVDEPWTTDVGYNLNRKDHMEMDGDWDNEEGNF